MVWLRFAQASAEPSYQAGPDTDGPALIELMGLTEEEFATRFSGSPIKVIVLRILLANCTSPRCPLKVRLRILRPMMVVYRYMVFSTRLRLL
jgi:hypothetical protein